MQEFETTFLEWFKNETVFMPEDIFLTLDKLFAEVDAYWPECIPGEETDTMISEQQLRIRAAAALRRLENLSQ